MKIVKRTCIQTVLLMAFCLVCHNSFSQAFELGTSLYDSTGFVEYIPGNLPIIISIPHGGSLEPNNISDRDCDIYTCSKDLFTQEMGRSISDAFFDQTGCYPHMIINLLHRRKFDANRDIMEAADGNATVEQAWYSYHSFIDTAKEKITEDYGRGLFLDLHGHSHNEQRIELGYLISKTELQLPNSDLDGQEYIDKSSIQSLVGDNLLSLTHSQLLRGDHSFGTLLESNQVAAVPSKSDPFPIGNEGYFRGGYNTERHGSANGGSIDAIQIECDQTIRFDANNRERFAINLTSVTNQFIDLHYYDQYEVNYCNITTNTSENPIQKAVNIYPNPAQDYIQIDSELKGIEVSIYNELGQKVAFEFWEGDQIDIDYLKSGYYIIELRKDKLKLSSQRLIKH